MLPQTQGLWHLAHVPTHVPKKKGERCVGNLWQHQRGIRTLSREKKKWKIPAIQKIRERPMTETRRQEVLIHTIPFRWASLFCFWGPIQPFKNSGAPLWLHGERKHIYTPALSIHIWCMEAFGNTPGGGFQIIDYVTLIPPLHPSSWGWVNVRQLVCFASSNLLHKDLAWGRRSMYKKYI